MADYPRPEDQLAIFNPEEFNPRGSVSLTTAKEFILAFPTAQGTEELQDANVSENVIVNANTDATGYSMTGSTINYTSLNPAIVGATLSGANVWIGTNDFTLAPIISATLLPPLDATNKMTTTEWVRNSFQLQVPTYSNPDPIYTYLTPTNTYYEYDVAGYNRIDLMIIGRGGFAGASVQNPSSLKFGLGGGGTSAGIHIVRRIDLNANRGVLDAPERISFYAYCFSTNGGGDSGAGSLLLYDIAVRYGASTWIYFKVGTARTNFSVSSGWNGYDGNIDGTAGAGSVYQTACFLSYPDGLGSFSTIDYSTYTSSSNVLNIRSAYPEYIGGTGANNWGTKTQILNKTGLPSNPALDFSGTGFAEPPVDVNGTRVGRGQRYTSDLVAPPDIDTGAGGWGITTSDPAKPNYPVSLPGSPCVALYRYEYMYDNISTWDAQDTGHNWVLTP
jgi:hypothetical protein